MRSFFGILLPFLGTSLGAACVFFMKSGLSARVRQSLSGFAAGVMVAASFTSLLVPAIRQSSALGRFAFVPALIGFWGGLTLLCLLDRRLPMPKSGTSTVMALAVTLHNIPEGMAVGAAYAARFSAMGALTLSLGIAVQNFPEGAIISMPLHAAGRKKSVAFACGVLSGAVEPLGAGLTLLAARRIVPALPYFLSFAAGAMLYVVLEELLPELRQGGKARGGLYSCGAGFAVMLALDLALG